MADFSLRIDQTNVPLAGSNELGSAPAVARRCHGGVACPRRLQRQSGGQSLVADGPLGLRRSLRGQQSLQSHQLRTEQHRARRRWALKRRWRKSIRRRRPLRGEMPPGSVGVDPEPNAKGER
jgi:hypothetical protein